MGDLQPGLPAQRRTLLVRLWVEPLHGEEEGGAWRGSVTEIPEGEARHFQGFAGLVGVLEKLLEYDGGTSPP